MTTEEVKPTDAKAPETKETNEAAPAAEPSYVITQEELDKLVGTVKANAPVDEKAIYEKAAADVRKEFELAQRSRLDEAARKAEAERIARLEAEITSLKENASQGSVRKGFATTTNPFQKTDDGKTAIKMDEMEKATRRFLNPNAR